MGVRQKSRSQLWVAQHLRPDQPIRKARPLKSSHKYSRSVTICGVISLGALSVCTALAGGPPTSARTNPALASSLELTKLRIREAYGKMPLSFEANQGQTDSRVKFVSRGSGYNLFLTANEAVLSLHRPPTAVGARGRRTVPGLPYGAAGAGFSGAAGSAAGRPDQTAGKAQHGGADQTVLRMKLVGADPHPEVSGLEKLPGTSNYFLGNDPKKWRTHVPRYAKVRYAAIYPGVDLVYYGNPAAAGQLEHDFVVAPGADPNAIKLAMDGAKGLKVDARGDLVLTIGDEEVRLLKPFIYQEVDGARKEISGGYALKDAQQVSFQVGDFDVSRPLIIDPVLVYSTYLGGSDMDLPYSIAVDASGNAYVTGATRSTDFPTAAPFQAVNAGGGGDTFVTKLNAAGNALVYSTYLGGSSAEYGIGIAVDGSGNAYVTGATLSGDFPTVNPFQAAHSPGSFDAFVTKLSAAGALVYSTYLGGSNYNESSGIAVDASGNAYVTGKTGSTDFPTANPFQASHAGGILDTFVTKLNPAGNALVYSTYLGGSGWDEGRGIAVDASGNAYVTGMATPANFPTADSFQAASAGGADAFVTKLSAAGDALVYSTYLGGSEFDLGNGIVVDASGNAYVLGYTNSTDFPTANAFQAAYAGNQDAFVTKLSAAGNALVYSSYLGGDSPDDGRGIAVDASGNAFVTGFTASTNFPTASPLQAAHAGGGFDAFVTQLGVTGNSLVYSTYLGGNGNDGSHAMAVGASGNAFVTGFTTSASFPTANPFQPAFAGGNADAFVTKISAPVAATLSDLINLVRSFNLRQGIANSLDAKLQNAQAALDAARAGDLAAACNQLGAFINQVQAQSGNALTVAQANQLITLTNQIKAGIGCP